MNSKELAFARMHARRAKELLDLEQFSAAQAHAVVALALLAAFSRKAIEIEALAGEALTA